MGGSSTSTQITPQFGPKAAPTTFQTNNGNNWQNKWLPAAPPKIYQAISWSGKQFNNFCENQKQAAKRHQEYMKTDAYKAEQILIQKRNEQAALEGMMASTVAIGAFPMF